MSAREMTTPGVRDPAGFEFGDVGRLLDSRPMALEMDAARLPSGVLRLAARTVMPGSSGAMFECWFCSTPDAALRPVDLLDHDQSAEWKPSRRRHWGSTHCGRRGRPPCPRVLCRATEGSGPATVAGRDALQGLTSLDWLAEQAGPLRTTEVFPFVSQRNCQKASGGWPIAGRADLRGGAPRHQALYCWSERLVGRLNRRAGGRLPHRCLVRRANTASDLHATRR